MTVASLHKSARPGSEKERIWAICDRLYAERKAIPSGREVADLYVSEGGNEGTGFTQYSHWKKAMLERLEGETGEHRAPEPGNVEAMALNISSDGRILVPQQMREAMMLDPDGRVTALVENGELRIVAPRAAIRRLQRMARQYRKPGESVVDELIAERRTEAMREDAET